MFTPKDCRAKIMANFADSIKPVENPEADKSYYGGDDCYQSMKKISRDKAAAFAHFTALKYLWRLGEKEGSNPIDDLNKAKWYIDRVIEAYKGD
jgi:Protein of unknwon function (DUF3310)